MCQAFSCLVLPDTSVIWQMGVDSHERLIKLAGLKDDTAKKDEMIFCRVEIAPKNKNYFTSNKWQFKIDQERPSWWSAEHANAAERAHKEWLSELEKILIKKPIVHPFRDIAPPEKITKKHIVLLESWDSVRDSVRASVGDSVWDSVRASVGDSIGASFGGSFGGSLWDSIWNSIWNSVEASVRASIEDSVRASVWDSVRDSVRAYLGSFFVLPREAWKYTENIKTDGYPFQPAVDLWMMGLVPSYDGDVWRLHGGKKAKILWKGKLET